MSDDASRSRKRRKRNRRSLRVPVDEVPRPTRAAAVPEDAVPVDGSATTEMPVFDEGRPTMDDASAPVGSEPDGVELQEESEPAEEESDEILLTDNEAVDEPSVRVIPEDATIDEPVGGEPHIEEHADESAEISVEGGDEDVARDSEARDSEDSDSEDGDSEDGDSEDGDSEDGDSEDGDSPEEDADDVPDAPVVAIVPVVIVSRVVSVVSAPGAVAPPPPEPEPEPEGQPDTLVGADVDLEIEDPEIVIETVDDDDDDYGEEIEAPSGAEELSDDLLEEDDEDEPLGDPPSGSEELTDLLEEDDEGEPVGDPPSDAEELSEDLLEEDDEGTDELVVSMPPPPPAKPQAPPPPPESEAKAPAPAKPAAKVSRASMKRKGRRNWWEGLFNDDYLRTVPIPHPKSIVSQCDFIEQRLGLARGATILDVGCGLGLHAVELTRRGYLVVGLDLSLPMLSRAADEAQEHGFKINFLHADMQEMNFDGAFDAVLCWGTTFGYFDDDSNRQVVERLFRSLKPRGLLLLDVVNRDYVIAGQPNLVWFEGDGCVVMEETQMNYITSRLEVKRTVILDDGRQRDTRYSLRLYTLHELGQVLHHRGFRVVEVSGRMAHPGVYFGADSPRLIILAERRPQTASLKPPSQPASPEAAVTADVPEAPAEPEVAPAEAEEEAVATPSEEQAEPSEAVSDALAAALEQSEEELDAEPGADPETADEEALEVEDLDEDPSDET